MVASFTGAWIETLFIVPTPRTGEVASFTGAWIETTGTGATCAPDGSRPSRARGSKQDDNGQGWIITGGRVLHGRVDRNSLE